MVHGLGVRHPARGVGGSQKVELWKLPREPWLAGAASNVERGAFMTLYCM